MWKRFLAATAVIVFLVAGGTATAVLLEVDSAVDAFNRESTPIAGHRGRARRRRHRRPADDPRARLRPPLRRHARRRTRPARTRSCSSAWTRARARRRSCRSRATSRSTSAGRSGVYRQDQRRLLARRARAPPCARSGSCAGRRRAFPIHHVVNVNFGGFTRAVNRLGCVYVDVDRRYFNDNHPPVQSPTDYATIDIKPGYQKLCGQDSLDFVRYRHFDTDFVRAARQQDFLSQAKEQVGVERLFGDRKELLRIFGRYTQTDIRVERRDPAPAQAHLRVLARPAAPREVPRRPRPDVRDDQPTTNLERARDEFLNAEASEGRAAPTRQRAARKTPSASARRERPRARPRRRRARAGARTRPSSPGRKLPFPVYYPERHRRGGALGRLLVRRAAHLRPLRPRPRKHRAYRMVVEAPGIGEYYGVQGTNWKDAADRRQPVGDARASGERKLQLFRDGTRLRLVAWKTDSGVYWVSNTPAAVARPTGR